MRLLICYLLLLGANLTSFAASASLISVREGEGWPFYELKYLSTPNYQVILFYGGFRSELSYKKAESFLKNLEKGKDIHLYIGRGIGGSVKQHKKFTKEILDACKGRFGKRTCKVVTYLDGQCSSMCTTLFLSGDERFARLDDFSNLGFHRTLVKLGDRRIPIQTVNGMVRYFSDFKGVDEEYLKKHKERIFNQPKSALYHVWGQELLDSGMAHDMTEKLDGTEETFLKSL